MAAGKALGSMSGPFCPHPAKPINAAQSTTGKEPVTGIVIAVAATLVLRCNIKSFYWP